MESEEKTIRKSVETYKKAVNKVYNKKLEDTVNLINGCISEEENKIINLENANEFIINTINQTIKVPNYFVDSLNSKSNTTYTNIDFDKILEKYKEEIKKDFLKYFETTFREKQKEKKLTKAEEVRKEIDEAKAIFEKLAQKKKDPKEEPKLTIWQKIKRIFSCKKCSK